MPFLSQEQKIENRRRANARIVSVVRQITALIRAKGHTVDRNQPTLIDGTSIRSQIQQYGTADRLYITFGWDRNAERVIEGKGGFNLNQVADRLLQEVDAARRTAEAHRAQEQLATQRDQEIAAIRSRVPLPHGLEIEAMIERDGIPIRVSLTTPDAAEAERLVTLLTQHWGRR